MSRGKEFVEKYPHMFTEDKDFWAREMDEHFSCENNYNNKIMSEREFIDGAFYWAEVHSDNWIPVQCTIRLIGGIGFFLSGQPYAKDIDFFLEIGERIERKSAPTKEEIKKALFDCAKIAHEKEGTLVERVFEDEAIAIMKLYGQL